MRKYEEPITSNINLGDLIIYGLGLREKFDTFEVWQSYHEPKEGSGIVYTSNIMGKNLLTGAMGSVAHVNVRKLGRFNYVTKRETPNASEPTSHWFRRSAVNQANRFTLETIGDFKSTGIDVNQK